MVDKDKIAFAIYKSSELIQCLTACVRQNDYQQLWLLRSRDLSSELFTLVNKLFHEG